MCRRAMRLVMALYTAHALGYAVESSDQTQMQLDSQPHVLDSCGQLNMTLCSASDSNDCKSYLVPVSQCYSPKRLFPRDPQWGPFDVFDVVFRNRSFIRSFYSSTDGICSNRTGSFTVPLGVRVGPFGKPRPTGTFLCSSA